MNKETNSINYLQKTLEKSRSTLIAKNYTKTCDVMCLQCSASCVEFNKLGLTFF